MRRQSVCNTTTTRLLTSAGRSDTKRRVKRGYTFGDGMDNRVRSIHSRSGLFLVSLILDLGLCHTLNRSKVEHLHAQTRIRLLADHNDSILSKSQLPNRVPRPNQLPNETSIR